MGSYSCPVNLPGVRCVRLRLASRVAASFQGKGGSGGILLQFVSPKVVPSIHARHAFTGFK